MPDIPKSNDLTITFKTNSFCDNILVSSNNNNSNNVQNIWCYTKYFAFVDNNCIFQLFIFIFHVFKKLFYFYINLVTESASCCNIYLYLDKVLWQKIFVKLFQLKERCGSLGDCKKVQEVQFNMSLPKWQEIFITCI